MTVSVQEKCPPSSRERTLAFVVMAVLIGVFAFILISDDVEVTTEELPIAIILLAILGFAAGALLPALMNVRFEKNGLKVKAAGGAAMFIAILYFGFQAIGAPVPAGDGGQGAPTAQQENGSGKLYAQLLQAVYGEELRPQVASTAYSGCYTNYGAGPQMVQSFWGTGSSHSEAKMNANYMCSGVCMNLGGTCLPLS